MKIILIIAAGILAFVWFLKACSVQKVFEETPPVQYIKNMPNKADRAKESAQSANRVIMINAINIYRSQEGEYPASLNDLVNKGYLQGIPQGEWNYDGNGNLK